jgi:hypothetical protein
LGVALEVVVCTEVEVEDSKPKEVTAGPVVVEVTAGPVQLVVEGVVCVAHTSFPLP